MDYHYQSVSNVKITKLLLVCKSGTAMDNKSQCVFYNWYLMFRLTWYSRCLVLRVKGKSSWHSKSVLNNPSPFFALKVVACLLIFPFIVLIIFTPIFSNIYMININQEGNLDHYIIWFILQIKKSINVIPKLFFWAYFNIL